MNVAMHIKQTNNNHIYANPNWHLYIWKYSSM